MRDYPKLSGSFREARALASAMFVSRLDTLFDSFLRRNQ